MEGKHVLLGVVCAALAMASTASNDHISAKNPAMCAPEGDSTVRARESPEVEGR